MSSRHSYLGTKGIFKKESHFFALQVTTASTVSTAVAAPIVGVRAATLSADTPNNDAAVPMVSFFYIIEPNVIEIIDGRAGIQYSYILLDICATPWAPSPNIKQKHPHTSSCESLTEIEAPHEPSTLSLQTLS
ncbi:hypothetical protein BCR41DRAFT_374544 [Lobosporangium transversale]|uniref:Uncharacterized protein n=1 Tax=Lobosporangium transversale TaxID=64571 RepID=A0A1Y2GA85_9FUNG|nr:hypothetical protein BCR41DRAFT_374544 [Lobosporangium transversale]ORZ05357.1 hypothetical protein BCR41DRAFT_374544 [Lobosporangium transversale]|eukprot:XP_021877049.1 hypothetical protein BCR41DRAFT_374544 [Lobosporangium transversale]